MGTSVSNIIVVTTPPLGIGPGPATGLIISNISTTSLTLSWSAPSSGSLPFSYQPQISANNGATWANIGSPTSAQTTSVTGLSVNTSYLFRVITSNSTGNSTSSTTGITTLSVLPSAPAGLAVIGSPSQNSISLQWNAPTTGTLPFTYQVQARTPTGTGAFAPIGSATTSTGISISGLSSASSYDFIVTAANLAGTGPTSSALVNVQTAGSIGSLPGPATGLAASGIGTTSLTLSWVAPTSGTAPFSYQPQQATPSASPVWVNIGAPIAATTVLVPSLTPNTAYIFQVVTTNTAGSSTSVSLGTMTASVLPDAPTGLQTTGSPTASTVPLAWSAPVSGTPPLTYQISLRTPSGSGSFVTAGPTTTSVSQTISGLTSNSGYDFEVAAINAAGTGPQSAILLNVLTAVAAGTAPGPATGLSVSALAATSLTLTWLAPSVGTPPFTYQPQRSINGGASWTDIGIGILATTVGVTGLTAATAYQFQIVTTNGTGSSASTAVSATTLSVIPTAPTTLAVVGSPTQTSITLQWAAPAIGTPPLTYQLSLRTPSGAGLFTPAGATTTSTTQTASGLAPASSYDFVVTATNAAGTSANSTILSNISTASATGVLPSAPLGLTVGTLTSSTVVLTWSPPATGSTPFQYVVQYQVVPPVIVTPGAPTGVTSTSVSTTSVALAWTAPAIGTAPVTYNPQFSVHGANTWTSALSVVSVLASQVTGLVPGTNYDFRISATNSSGTGPFSAIYTVATPPANQFMARFGTNGHMDFTATVYAGNSAAVGTAMRYLGWNLFRQPIWTGYSVTDYNGLAAQGLFLDVDLQLGENSATTFLAAVDQFVTANPGHVIAIEGANEVVNWPVTFGALTGIPAANALQQSLFSSVRADPKVSTLPVYMYTFGNGNPSQLGTGNQSAFATYGNAHIYPHQSIGGGVTPYTSFQANVPFQVSVITPSLNTVITEGGYYTMPDADYGVNNDVQMRYTLDMMCDAYVLGYPAVYFYELFDNQADPGNTNAQFHFGLFNSDFSPKPVATAIHNFNTILNGAGTGGAAFTATGLPNAALQFGLVDSVGATYIVVWAEPVIWNQTTQTQSAGPPNSVVVTFNRSYASVTVFDPIISATAQTTLTNVSQATVNVTDHPIIVRII